MEEVGDVGFAGLDRNVMLPTPNRSLYRLGKCVAMEICSGL